MKEYHILHLEDSKTDSELIKRELLKAGLHFSYFLAHDKEGLERGLNEFEPNVVLCDHSMPSFNSKKAFILCKEKKPDIPFILVTGTVSEEFAVDMIKTGIDDYLLKTNLQRLPMAISKAFSKRENDSKIKSIQSELLQSEIHLRTVFENSSIGFVLLDRNWVILELNHSSNYFASLAYGIQLKKNQNLLSRIPDYGKKELRKYFDRVLKGERIRYEAVYTLKDETVIHFNVHLSPVIGLQGQVKGCCLYVEDISDRRKNELALLKSENFNNGILTSLNFHIAVAEANGDIISVNKAWSDFAKMNVKTVLERTEIGGNYIEGCQKSAKTGDAIVTKALNGFQQVVRKEIPFFELEYPCLSPGEHRWFLFRIVNFLDDSAKVVIMHIDITDRIKAELEVRDYKQALDASSAVEVSDCDGIIQYANENFCNISKYPAGELIGQDHRIFNSGYHTKGLFMDLWDTISSGNIWRNEIRNKAKDGSYFWLDVTIIPFLDIRGKPSQFITIGNDITTRKTGEARMMEAVERYDILADATSDTIRDWDVVNTTIVYNAGISRNFGYSAADIENGVDWWNEKLHPDDFQKVAETLEEIFAKRLERFQLSYRFRCADGSYKHIYDRSFLMFDESGKPSRVIGAMQDITFQAQEEITIGKAIIEAQDNERRFIGEELHDNINQILAGSLLTLGMIKDALKNTEDALGFIEMTKQYIVNAIDEIRGLSHQLVPVCLDTISLKEIFEKLLNQINIEKKFAITLAFEEINETYIPGIVQLNLYRILQEQVKNILKYSEADLIEVTVTLAGKAVRMRIFDNGKGFDTKRSKNGIGLSNIKNRAESFSGRFVLNSAEGRGCEIIVEIPLADKT